MVTRLILIVLTCLYMTGFHIKTASATPPSKILEIAVDENFPPYTIRHSDGSFGGLHVEILRGALRHAKIPFKFIGRPWKRVIHLTDNSLIDASLPWRAKKERFDKYLMTGPITRTGSRTVFLAQRNFPLYKWKDLTDLKQYKIGTIAGYAYPSTFEKADYLNKVEVTADNDVLLKLLDRGRVDLVIGDEHVLAAEEARLGFKKHFKQVGQPLESVKRYVAVPKSKAETASLIQQAINAFHETPEYDKILKKYQ